jgi:hypothetical protein
MTEIQGKQKSYRYKKLPKTSRKYRSGRTMFWTSVVCCKRPYSSFLTRYRSRWDTSFGISMSWVKKWRIKLTWTTPLYSLLSGHRSYLWKLYTFFPNRKTECPPNGSLFWKKKVMKRQILLTNFLIKSSRKSDNHAVKHQEIDAFFFWLDFWTNSHSLRNK